MEAKAAADAKAAAVAKAAGETFDNAHLPLVAGANMVFTNSDGQVMPAASIAWIVIVAVARVVRNEFAFNTQQLLFLAAGVLALILIIGWILSVRASRKAEDARIDEEERLGQPFDPFAGGFPVPPMPGQVAQPSRRTKATISSGAAAPLTPAETTEGTNV